MKTNVPVLGEAQPRLNIFLCNECGESILSVDVASGVSPQQIACLRSKPKGTCQGSMFSAGYNVAKSDLHDVQISYEWYRPQDLKALKKRSLIGWRYVLDGGLILRKRTEAPMLCYDKLYRDDEEKVCPPPVDFALGKIREEKAKLRKADMLKERVNRKAKDMRRKKSKARKKARRRGR